MMSDSYKQLAQEALSEHGGPILEAFLSMVKLDGRMLDQAADMIFMMMRNKMTSMPTELQRELGKLKGLKRIAAFIMMIAPHYIADMPEEKVREGVEKLLPYAERIIQLDGGRVVYGDSFANLAGER